MNDKAIHVLGLVRATDIVESINGELTWTSTGLHDRIPIRCGLGLHFDGTWSAYGCLPTTKTAAYDTRARDSRALAIVDAEIIAGALRRGWPATSNDGPATSVHEARHHATAGGS